MAVVVGGGAGHRVGSSDVLRKAGASINVSVFSCSAGSSAAI